MEVELCEIEILDLKGEMREIAMKSYHRLLKDVDKPIYLVRTDEQACSLFICYSRAL